MSASYRQIPRLIESRQDFNGNSLRGARKLPGVHVSSGRGSARFAELAGMGDYVVYSYATPIAYAVGNELFVTSERFSTTTSRGQNLILSCAGAREIDPENVKTLAEIKSSLGV